MRKRQQLEAGEMGLSNFDTENSDDSLMADIFVTDSPTGRHQPVDYLSEGSVMTTLGELNSGNAALTFGQPMMAAPQLDGGNAAHTFGQPMMVAPQQHLPYHPTVGNLSGSSITSSSAALPPTVVQNLVPVQLVNGQVVFMVVKDGSKPAAPSLNTSVTKKRKHKEQQDDGLPYVKKPPNAFMLFRKEQRPNVVAELNVRDCAAVNKVLGQKWKMLSKEEQAKYYEEAAIERLRHTINHPGWSTRQNYGKKRWRQRRKAPTTADKT